LGDRIARVVRKDNPESEYFDYETEQEALNRVLEENSDMEVKDMFQTDNNIYILFTKKKKGLVDKLKELLNSFFREGDTKNW